MKNYYDILGIEKSSSKDEIKKAFRKLAQKHHPDKSGGDEKKFKEINEAYQILSDDGKRKEYDTYGQVFSQGGATGGAGFGGFGGFDFTDFTGVAPGSILPISVTFLLNFLAVAEADKQHEDVTSQ